MVKDITSEVARRYFWLRKEFKHKEALGKVKEEFNLPLHFIMGFDNLQETWDKWKSAKRLKLTIPVKLTQKGLGIVAKKISLQGLKIIDSDSHEIVGETVRYTAEIKENTIELKALLQTKGKSQLDLICDPFEDFSIETEEGIFYDEIDLIAIELK